MQHVSGPFGDGLAWRGTRRTVLGAAVACGLAGGARAARNWRFATAYADGIYHTQNLRAFAERWAGHTGGAIGVEVHANASLAKMPDILPALQTGSIELGEVYMSAYAKQFPVLNFDALPFIVRNYDDARLMWKVSRKEVEDALAAQGIQLLYAVPWPPQALLSARRLTRLADLGGLSFRVNNEATQRIAELAKGRPVNISAADLEAAIRDKRAEVMLTSSVTAVDCKAWSGMKLFYDVNAWTPKNMVCASRKAYDSLTPAQQQALLADAAEAEQRGWALAQQADDAARRELAAHQVALELPEFELRRDLAKLGEKMSQEWAHTAGLRTSLVLVDYFRLRG
ncbi:TRAP transporter substrate-binding protein DctP [Xylophilus sp. GW821-FHT01B05]